MVVPTFIKFILCTSLLLGIQNFTLSADEKNVTDSRQLSCDVAQHGFHLNLRCDLFGPPLKHIQKCVLQLRLSRALYVDPYELVSQQPGLNFSLASPNLRKKGTLSRWYTWITGTPNLDPTKDDISEQYMDHNAVNVESPEWLSEPMTMYFVPNPPKSPASTNIADIPLHVRYRLPHDSGSGSVPATVKVPRPVMKCNDPKDHVKADSRPPFEVAVKSPISSDLLYVLPITILLLLVGMFSLLAA